MLAFAAPTLVWLFLATKGCFSLDAPNPTCYLWLSFLRWDLGVHPSLTSWPSHLCCPDTHPGLSWNLRFSFQELGGFVMWETSQGWVRSVETAAGSWHPGGSRILQTKGIECLLTREPAINRNPLPSWHRVALHFIKSLHKAFSS